MEVRSRTVVGDRRVARRPQPRALRQQHGGRYIPRSLFGGGMRDYGTTTWPLPIFRQSSGSNEFTRYSGERKLGIRCGSRVHRLLGGVSAATVCGKQSESGGKNLGLRGKSLARVGAKSRMQTMMTNLRRLVQSQIVVTLQIGIGMMSPLNYVEEVLADTITSRHSHRHHKRRRHRIHRRRHRRYNCKNCVMTRGRRCGGGGLYENGDCKIRRLIGDPFLLPPGTQQNQYEHVSFFCIVCFFRDC